MFAKFIWSLDIFGTNLQRLYTTYYTLWDGSSALLFDRQKCPASIKTPRQPERDFTWREFNTTWRESPKPIGRWKTNLAGENWITTFRCHSRYLILHSGDALRRRVAVDKNGIRGEGKQENDESDHGRNVFRNLAPRSRRHVQFVVHGSRQEHR